MAKVNDCLGLSVTDSYVRYAKVVKDNNNMILKQYGVKFVKDTIKESILEVINDTDSKNVPIAINAPTPIYTNFSLFKHISNMDIGNAVNLEFTDWCEQNNVMPDKYQYISFLSDLAIGDYKSGIIAISEKSKIEEFSSIKDFKITAMYPNEVLSKNLVAENISNYILVNLDEELAITTVLNGKINTINHYDVGMKQVFEKFSDVLGSFTKAYEACKQINVYNEDSTTSKVQLEEILEPILQNVLNKSSETVNKYKNDVDKILLTGSCVLFTNIDTLFTEYFNVKSELLKPEVTTQESGVRNIAEIIEVNSAIALAIETINPSNSGIAFFNYNLNKFSKFKSILDMINTKKKKNVVNKEFNINMDNVNKGLKIAMYPIIALGIVPIVYFALSNIYVSKINGLSDSIKLKVNEYTTQSSKINDDISYISNSASQYKRVNDEIDGLVKQIENEEIGKFTTYNVASFMQKLVLVIPRNVKLISVSSDDNKHIKINAEADEYPAIGYFVAALRSRTDILKDVKINSINNGTKITIEIGGELP